MQIIHPIKTEHRLLRDELLQVCLRDQGAEFRIDREYPTLLSPDTSERSFVGIADGEILCHANLWPRIAIGPNGVEGFPCAIIANVATRIDMRGKGLSRLMLDHLAQVARERGYCALILWSNEDDFYRKQGFIPFGAEARVTVKRAKSQPIGFQLIQKASEAFLQRCNQIRPTGFWTLKREVSEFQQVLNVPNTLMFSTQESCSYIVIGKGADLQGVVHEWGGPRVKELIDEVMARYGLEELLVLTPSTHKEEWPASTLVPTAWIRVLNADLIPEAFMRSAFIWGLDSA